MLPQPAQGSRKPGQLRGSCVDCGAELRCCWPEDGGSLGCSWRWKPRGLLRASSPAREQTHLNPTAQEPSAAALFGFKAWQAHLGLSRHANPAPISSWHFPLLSRPAFLLSPSPCPGALTQNHRVIESQNHYSWKRPLRSSSPTVNPSPP